MLMRDRVEEGLGMARVQEGIPIKGELDVRVGSVSVVSMLVVVVRWARWKAAVDDMSKLEIQLAGD